MTELDRDFQQEVQKVWDALVADLGVAPVRFVLQRGMLHAFLQGDVLSVPDGHEKHFRRFGTIPTSLLRDAAYEAKKRQLGARGERGSSLEADALAYAEIFLRAALSQADGKD